VVRVQTLAGMRPHPVLLRSGSLSDFCDNDALYTGGVVEGGTEPNGPQAYRTYNCLFGGDRLVSYSRTPAFRRPETRLPLRLGRFESVSDFMNLTRWVLEDHVHS